MKQRNTREYNMREAFDQGELRRRESLCIHGEPAFCVAACPIHLDARGLCQAVEAGDFSNGRRLIAQVTPFVNLLSTCCDAPCASDCKRRDKGGAVNISGLEMACAQYASTAPRRLLPTKSKGKSVAVAGDDLFCFALAYELSVKAYDVVLYCAYPSLQGALLAQYPEMERDKLEADLKALQDRPVQLNYNAEFAPEFISGLRARYDYACCSYKVHRDLYPDASVDPVTLISPSGFISAEAGGVVQSLHLAKSAAVTIDRLSQNIAPESNRDREGSYETSLITAIDGINDEPAVIPAGGLYTKEQAMTEASRCIGCECTLCIDNCVYLQDYKRSPKQMLREYYNNLSIVMGNHMANKMINSCSLCGLCAEVCPKGFDLPDACITARQTMVVAGKMPPSAHEFALLDMQFSLGEEFFTVLRDSGAPGKYVFFPGCQACAILPETILKAYNYLRESNTDGVDIILGCCGMPAYWAGQTELFNESIEKIKRAWESLGSPTIITACPNCMSVFRDNLTSDIVGVWSVIEPPPHKEGAGRLTVHDSCGSRYDERAQSEVRDLAASMGYELTDATLSKSETACCGYGGLVGYANREMSGHMARYAAGVGEDKRLVYCASCRDRFMREDKDSVHLLELIFGSEDGGSPDLSLRRINRKKFKEEIIKIHGGIPPVDRDFGFKLTISGEVRALMDERMILESDIMAVIDNARATGSYILDSQSGELITNYRIGNVTFWVRYTNDGDEYTIKSAYSHRMTVAGL